MLEPDETDIRLILKAELLGCPCCDGTPTTFARFFPHSGIYQSYVHCSRCDVQVFKNAHDREEARQLAIAAWNRRAPAQLDQAREALTTLTAERDAARKIVREIHWMARRYADGRMSYAVGMCNDALRVGYEAGWLEHKIDGEPAYARDGMFDQEYITLSERLRSAEAERDAALARVEALEGKWRELLGPDEQVGTWTDAAAPLVARFSTAGQFGADAVHNGEGAKAIAMLLETMARALDNACSTAKIALGEVPSHPSGAMDREEG